MLIGWHFSVKFPYHNLRTTLNTRLETTFATMLLDISLIFVFMYSYMKQYLNAAEVARIQKVHKSTVIKWIKKGYFEGVKRPGGKGQYRIPLASYEEFVKKSRV